MVYDLEKILRFKVESTFDCTKCNSANLLVIDSVGSEWMHYCIPENTLSCVIPVRDTVPYIKSVRFMFNLMQMIIKYGITKKALITAVINTVKPRIILSHIDNAEIISHLSKHFAKNVVVVQNGSRDSYINSRLWGDRFYIANYFGFGDYEYDLMKKLGVNIMNYYPVGSIRMSVFMSSLQKHTDDAGSQTICFISQYRYAHETTSNDFLKTFHDYHTSIYKMVLSWVNRHEYSLVVAMKYEKNMKNYVNEFDYYNNISGNVLCIANNHKLQGSYKLAYSSNMIITLNSTLGFEMFGVGKKVLFCDFDPQLKYNDIDQSIYSNLPAISLLQSSAPEIINDKLCLLWNMSDEDYKDKTYYSRDYYMKNNVDYTYDTIKSFLFNRLRN